jgi:hypothetical protein
MFGSLLLEWEWWAKAFECQQILRGASAELVRHPKEDAACLVRFTEAIQLDKSCIENSSQ